MRTLFSMMAVAALLVVTMMQKDMPQDDKTKEILASSLAGEATANRKYMAFAKVADQEGYKGVGKLYRAAATAEAIHARNYMNLLGMIKTTQENLEGSVGGEQEEFASMYPAYIKTAQEAGNMQAAEKLSWANQVEQKHFKMFTDDLTMIKAGQNPADHLFFVCCTCGNTVMDKAPDVCDVCGSPQSKFFKVD